MITASQAKTSATIAREKNFGEDSLKINNAIQQAADRGLMGIIFDIDKLTQMKEAGFWPSDIHQLLVDVLVPLGYSLSTYNDSDSVCIEWK